MITLYPHVFKKKKNTFKTLKLIVMQKLNVIILCGYA